MSTPDSIRDDAKVEQEGTMRHRHSIQSRATWGWTTCVVRGSCDGHAHGNIVDVDTCACGATRSIECNGGWTGRGPWRVVEAQVRIDRTAEALYRAAARAQGRGL
jgi:hypothetical protein